VNARVSATWLREDGDGVVLRLHVIPGARRSEVVGVHGEGAEARLRLRLAAPPVDGKANAELRRFLAEAFGVPVACVTLDRGEASRQKTVQVASPSRRPEWCC